MLMLDAFFRFSGLGLLLMLGVLTLLYFRKWKSAPYLILTCISVSAVFIGYSPRVFQPSGLAYQIIRLLDIPHLVFLWLFTLSLFQSNFVLKRSYIAISILYCAPLTWVRFEEFGWVSKNPALIKYIISSLSVLLMIHLCTVTLKGRKDDLLHKRRKSRIYFVIVIVFVTVVAAISDPFASQWDRTIKVLIIWPAIIWGFIWMTSFDKMAVTFTDEIRDKSCLSERDKQLRDKLTYEMKIELAFKDSKLSIVTLASKLGVTQHRLRALINQILGYNNFSEFVNTYRLDAIKLALADDKNNHIPILTLAMDCGFNSLSSFNRIFKKSENKTPTEYRDKCQPNQI